MDEHIALQLIDEPAVQSINIITGEETLEDNRTDLQIFLETWAKAEMNPDEFQSKEEMKDNVEACEIRAKQHLCEACQEFNSLIKILNCVLQASHLDIKGTEPAPTEPTNPDIKLGTVIVDKQLQLQSFAKFFLESASETRQIVSVYQKYFRNLDQLSHKFPIVFFYDYGKVNFRAATIPPDPPIFKIPWIVLPSDNDGNIIWKLSNQSNFNVNNQDVFFESESPYRNLSSKILLQYLFLVVREEMISKMIDYSINKTSTAIEYTAGNTNLKLDITNTQNQQSSSKTKKKNNDDQTEKVEKSGICPIYIPAMVSMCLRPNPAPFKTYKEIIDEKILIDNAVNIIFNKFLKCDFCEVKYQQRKRGVVIQIHPLYGTIAKYEFSPHLFKESTFETFEKVKEEAQKETDRITGRKPFTNNDNNNNNGNTTKSNNDTVNEYTRKKRVKGYQSYFMTCYLAHNHFCATDPKSQYSYVSIDLRSRGSNAALTKWCEAHYFKMIQATISAVASRFGYKAKITDQTVSVKCDAPRKVKLYNTGKGDLDVEVIHDTYKWRTKWMNLPIHNSVKKIEYLFFFNFLNRQ